MLQTVVAIERDGLDFNALALCFEVPDKDFDLVAAVRAAAAEFCNTKEGRKVYEGNCDAFNWADFAMYVPAELCEKHGFKMVQSELSDIIVDWDEYLVEEEEEESYTAYLYEDDGITANDYLTYDKKADAINFAKEEEWDEVVNDITGEVVWRR